MNTKGVLIVTLLFSAAGCASSGRSGDAGMGSAPATQQETALQARDYRTQADALREMAARREFEANLLSKQLGPDDPSVGNTRRLAAELRAAADEAENTARDLRRNVPHNMVQ